ncbi:ABC transporter [Bosea sp. Leaf344]|uniref:ABC transporter ATP-binding protein n=1 Tax=Bosea sp. Leaf344 TaxID=1736346 RepID=UPI0006F3ED98|nr:ATP-binding cassette domain-containing protein [Bosea sp. Leaf344]KQU51128.1 ABC transporter [Bosea sp. Leaf344]
MPALEIEGLEVRFPGLDAAALSIARLHLPKGASLAVTGGSGSGKSTLVNVLAGLAPITRGRLSWGGTDLARLSALQRDRFRARSIGLVLQEFHLFPGLSAFDNVVLPIRLSRRLSGEEAERARSLLDIARIARPRQAVETMSRGEMQRVAVARALLGRPQIVLADEPTASLDRSAGRDVAQMLLGLAEECGATLIVVTHDAALAERLGRQIRLDAGRVLADPVQDRAA